MDSADAVCRRREVGQQCGCNRKQGVCMDRQWGREVDLQEDVTTLPVVAAAAPPRFRQVSLDSSDRTHVAISSWLWVGPPPVVRLLVVVGRAATGWSW
jgi:hypothetical protein